MVPKNEIRSGSLMRSHPARAMYDQIEDALTSITMQLRSAIEADAHRPHRVNGKANGASVPFQVAGARKAGTTVTVSLPLP